MHKAITILMLKLECQVIDRNPDFKMQDRDFLRRINWEKETVMVGDREYPMRDTSFPTVDPADPTALNSDEKVVLQKLVQSFRQSEKLQQHVEFLYAKGSVYHIENGNLLYHGAVPMTRKGTFAVERFEGHAYSGRALMDYCDERARRGYFVSFNYGLNETQRVRRAYLLALKTAIGCGVCFALITIFCSKEIVSMFIDRSYPAYDIAVEGLPLYASGFIFFAINIVSIGYFQSVERAQYATVITLLRGFILLTLCFYGLPLLLGKPGIWLATPLAELLTTIFIVVIYIGRKRNDKENSISLQYGNHAKEIL